MKRFLLIFLIISLPFYFIYSQSLKIEREIDLSFFLKPHQPHLVFAAVDLQGNIFITQRGKDSFIKVDPTGEVILRAPQKIEGEIIKFDIDNNGNPVCVFFGRKEGSYFIFPLVWFDGITGRKIREINLGEKFNFVAHIKILRPKDIVLVNGVAKDEELRKHSLHLVDFNGNCLQSFSPFKKQGNLDDVLKENQDYFASPPQIDSNSMTILQAFPSISLIEIFDYSGNHIGQTEWIRRKKFLIHSENLWFQDAEGFRVFEKKGNNYIPTKVIIKDVKKAPVHWYPIATDSSGNIYFLGEKEFQALKIYTMQ